MAYVLYKTNNMEYIRDFGLQQPYKKVTVTEIRRSMPKCGKKVKITAQSRQIHFITSGKCLFSHGDGPPTEINAGTAVSVAQGEEYTEHVTDSNFRQCWINYGGADFDGTPAVFSFTGISDVVIKVFDSAFAKKGGGISEFFALSALYTLLNAIFSISVPIDKGYVSLCREYICSHYSEDLSLEKLALNIGVSPKYLSRIFKNESGQTISQFITQSRMLTAGVRLRGSNDSVSLIARESGFADPLYFSRVFKSFYGVSPTNYRK